jgi:hypothetical protein
MSRLAALLLLAPGVLAGQEPPRPISLSWQDFAVTLTGPARPAGYLGVIGRRAAFLGAETDSVEAVRVESLLAQRLDGNALVLTRGLAGRTYEVPLRTPQGITGLVAAMPAGGGDPVDGYVRREPPHRAGTTSWLDNATYRGIRWRRNAGALAYRDARPRRPGGSRRAKRG